MENPTPPLVFNDHGDLDLYESVEELARDLEIIDVQNEEYECFDATGAVLALFVQPTREDVDQVGRSRTATTTIGVRVAQPSRSEPERLTELITAFLTATDQTTQEASGSSEELPLLLERLAKRLGKYRP